ncbi:MAG TPA: cbb3-type cytochrome c oxidase subunit I [Candidatus Obscuribacterales bacterium]
MLKAVIDTNVMLSALLKAGSKPRQIVDRLALLVVQVGLGAVTAHYGVEGSGFYSIPLSEWLPYAVTRTWHTQLGIFWIATTWLATGLFIAPAVTGYEPRFQRAGVNLLFLCLLVIVVGSMAGEWLGVQQKLGLNANFWFGHQGACSIMPGVCSIMLGCIFCILLSSSRKFKAHTSNPIAATARKRVAIFHGPLVA